MEELVLAPASRRLRWPCATYAIASNVDAVTLQVEAVVMALVVGQGTTATGAEMEVGAVEAVEEVEVVVAEVLVVPPLCRAMPHAYLSEAPVLREVLLSSPAPPPASVPWRHSRGRPA